MDRRKFKLCLEVVRDKSNIKINRLIDLSVGLVVYYTGERRE